MKTFILFSFLFLTFILQGQHDTVQLVVLGTVQDGGSPHIGCKKACCASLYKTPDPSRKVVSLGLIDFTHHKKYLFEATPDMPAQLNLLENISKEKNQIPDGIFVSHAHIGHYSGLMYLGKEALNSKAVPVYVLPRMKAFLETNGPWSQLVSINNIKPILLQADSSLALESNIRVIPFQVPHRDEYSETVGFKIIGPHKKALFIPDIDKWHLWKRDIREELKQVDYLFCDATFFDETELTNRKMSEIPHPFVVESMKLFSDLSKQDKNKVYFIHFNHTNPCFDQHSKAAESVLSAGYHFAMQGMMFDL